MPTLDFSELADNPAGETFEGLVRLIGQRLGLQVQWSGRGADGGRDLIFVELQAGAIGTSAIRWLVNCKDNSKSNQAVSEQDVGSVLDKVKQHSCDGFLLATTTMPGTALKEKLDRLASAPEGRIHTKVWDRFELTNFLLSEKFASLLLQFFPKHSARSDLLRLDSARAIVEQALPRQVVGILRLHLLSSSQRHEALEGSAVWPIDKDQQELINEIVGDLLNSRLRNNAISKLEVLHFDPFMALMDRLIRNYPWLAKITLTNFAKATRDQSRLYHCIQTLREFDSFGATEEAKLTKLCSAETLDDLYGNMVMDELGQKSYWAEHMPSEIKTFASDPSIQDVDIQALSFDHDDEQILFAAEIRIGAQGFETDYDGEYQTVEDTFHIKAYGTVDQSGFVVTELE